MKIVSIFMLLMIHKVISRDDGLEILSVGVDGLLMENAKISASETCGVDGPEKYCRLVDERSAIIPFNQESNVLCDICDDRNETKRHPIEYAKSNDDNLWWQSPSMAQGLKYQNISVTIDLKQVYQIVYILLRMGDSPRPGNWIMERSLDGQIYLPWIFFAETPYSCYNLFQQQYPDLRLTSSARPNLLDDDEIFCTTYYSQPTSLNSGEIIISLINGRKSLMVEDYLTARSVPQKLINFLSARFIRFRFLKHLTLAADLMTHKGYLEKSIYNRYFYSLRNIEIGGKCICNNHADQCDKVVINGITVAKCNCKHNTCGSNCEKCCPLFNQKPWKPIVPCEECNCNRKSTICVYNQTVATLQMSTNKMGRMEGGGVCLNCKENTEGINCEKCKKRFYRPWNVLATEPFPCKPCNCHGIGTFGDCVSNGEEVDNQKPGDCICKLGYAGYNCQLCSIGYERYPNGECLPCPCSIDGSVTSSLYRCKPPCNCKINVEPSNECRTCKNGFFNLDPKNPEGCQACYCFGITNQCTSLNAKSLQGIDFRYFLGLIHDLTNWKISTVSDTKKATPKMTALQYPSSENSYLEEFFNNPLVYYWEAPEVFLGNWLISYRSFLQYVLKIELASPTEGSQIDSPDVILKCGKSRLFHSVSSEDRRLQRNVFIYLKPSYWSIGQMNPQREATKDEFISCLVNIDTFMIKAKYYSNQISIGLLNITLYRGDPDMAFNEMPYIEKCSCSPGFAGLSCESCIDGYRRVNNTLFQGQCEPCNCYNHSNTCDPFTGECRNCLHNTNGRYCDECDSGYYGDSKSRRDNACKKCACPLIDYQMTDRCSTLSPEFYLCHGCKNNTFGSHCNRCADGYYGNPERKIPCRKCECNGNEVSCSEITGECKCSFNTMGKHCDLCKYGYFGNALSRNCKECECSSIGSKNEHCDRNNGQCLCQSNFVNRKCDSCAPGFHLKGGNCVECICDTPGTIPSKDFCNSVTGQCHCRNGITGERCDQCLPGYYGYPNCKKCQCSSHALSFDCDRNNGHCKCGEFVADNNCDKCQDGHYWINRTQCTPCKCGRGSVSDYCDMNTGNCKCAINVIMRDCSKCNIGYYGLSSVGCKECPTCYNGQICDDKGVCSCPPNTAGQYCEKCSDNSWNYNGTFGCKKCDCSLEGSLSKSCNKITGECLCQQSYKGAKCTECNDNFYGFPNCKPCECSINGTMTGTQSMCDSISGQCQCKSNTLGRKCDLCKSGTFPSTSAYEGGCLSCFCFGMSETCEPLSNHRIVQDAKYEYNIFAEKYLFDSKDQSLMKLNSSSSKRFGWPFTSLRPVYVEVSQFFNSTDLTMFYRSTIMNISIICLDSKCGRENSTQQEVILESYNGLFELRYVVNHSSSNEQDINIELSENPDIGQWIISKYRSDRLNKFIYLNNPSEMNINLTRDIFMMALLNVTSIKVQLYPGKISPPIITLKLVTYHVIETLTEVGKPVTAVEKCHCNSITAGNHCQKPIDGYFKQSINLPELEVNIDGRSSQRIVANVRKCDCNGHSSFCDGITGVCYNCSDNTSGSKCDVCADGFHGNPKNNGQCQPCQCPNKQFNFAKSCVKLPSRDGYQCECLKGYSGSVCDRCQIGFYGSPTRGIRCKPCDCNPEGSTTISCDLNGVCQCFPGVLGTKCDQCAANHVVENKKCQSCYSGCTNELFTRIDKLNNTIINFNWKTLPSNFDRKIQEMNISTEKLSYLLIPLDKFYNIRNDLKNLSIEFQRTKATAKEKYNMAKKVKNMYIEALNRLISVFKEINETMSTDKFLGSSEHIINNATNILKIIESLFNEIPNITDAELFIGEVRKYVDELNKAIKKTHNSLQLKQLENLSMMKKKTLLANEINKDNQEYLKMLERKNEEYELEISKMGNMINSSEELVKMMIDKKNQLRTKIQKSETIAQDFQNLTQLRTEIINYIEELLANFSINSSPKLFIPDIMKKHVENQLNKSALLIKNLTKEFSFLHNAEQAKEAYSNISRDIADVDGAINETQRQLHSSKSSLNLVTMVEFLNESYDTRSNLEKKKNEIDIQTDELRSQYIKLSMAQMKLKENNDQQMLKIPSGYTDIYPLKQNLSAIQVEQNNMQVNSIVPITDILTSFQIPSLSSVFSSDDIQKSVLDLKGQYSSMVNDTVDIHDRIKKMRENIKYLRERLSKARTAAELIHGTIARSSEPIRHTEICVRHYITYYLPKSIAFSLEFYMKPQFPDQQSLVLFGYDDSQITPQAFAFTIERNNQYVFWYSYGNNVETIKITKNLTNENYVGVFITWKLGQWVMSIKSIVNNIENQEETIISSNFNVSHSVRIGPQTNVFVGGFPSTKLLGKLKLEGKLISDLKENYGSHLYKGCLFGVKLLNSEFGLQDIEAVDEECKKTISIDHLLSHRNFSCRLNLAKLNKFQTKEDNVKVFDLIFSGNGYAMINTSKIKGCVGKLNTLLSISALPISAMNTDTFQLIAAFVNDMKNIGFVLGQRYGQYQFGFWNGSHERKLTNLHNISETFKYYIHQANVNNFNEKLFDVNDICDSNSYIYLGDIPDSENKLIGRLKRLEVPNFGFAGNLRMLVHGKNIFKALATRFVNVVYLHAERPKPEYFQSLFISSEVNRAITITNPYSYNILNHGFAFSVDFMGKSITNSMILLTLELTQGIISVEITKHLEFIFIFNKNRITKRLTRYDNDDLDWGPRSIVVSFFGTPPLYVSIVIDNEELQMDQLIEPLGQQSLIKIGSDSNSPQAYYFYHLFLGQKLVNFDELPNLPPGVFLKRRVTQLQPSHVETVKVDLVNPTHRPEDYPINSAWFDGISNHFIGFTSTMIDEYRLTTNNEISFMIRSASLRPEMLISLDFGFNQTLNLVTINGQIIMFDSTMKLIALFPVRLVDEEWHTIRILAGLQNPERGIRVYQDSHRFDFIVTPFPFSIPQSIYLGGYTGSSPTLFYNNKLYEIQFATGCFDSFKINNRTVSLSNEYSNGNSIKQCPRVLEFLNSGGHILDSYSHVQDSSSLIKLKISSYSTSDSENIYETKFKFKYNGYEQGNILITGDVNRFCSISIKNREMQINYHNFDDQDHKTESIKIMTEKWYKVELIVIHFPGLFTWCKMVVDEAERAIELSTGQMFTTNFKHPEIYFGGYPNLSADKVRQLTYSDRNFVGCISDIAFYVNNVLVPCGFDKSPFIIGGRCSVDKTTYLLRLL